LCFFVFFFFFFSSRRRHTRFDCDWSSDVCSSDLAGSPVAVYWTAIVEYSRAVIFLETGKLDDAVRLARKSARIFRQFGEDERYVHAKILEGAVLFDHSRFRDARELFLSLLPFAKRLGDATSLARLYLNIDICQL